VVAVAGSEARPFVVTGEHVPASGYQDVEVELPPNWNPEVDHAFVVLSPNGKTGFNFSFEEAVKFGKELVHLSDIMRHGGSSA
jgi:ABC-type hemin transport system ATPase subunit